MEFIDLHAQQHALGDTIKQSIAKVLQHGGYILGKEVQILEEQLSLYTGAKDVVTCSNGTDALRLLLMAYQVGPGDAVFVPTFTFASTAEVVAQANATPVFVDICPKTYNIDLNSLQEAIEKINKSKLTPKGIIAVDLFGLPANYAEIHTIAEHHGLWVIADAAQSFGGGIGNQMVGNLAHTTATSFFPSKPLACYGDGGAVFTRDEKMGALIRSLRNHGCGAHRYDHIHIGFNSRLDTLQAAILIEKLRIFPLELQRRIEVAAYYSKSLKNVVSVPGYPAEYTHAFGLYTILCQQEQRDHLMKELQANDIPTNVYYRKPLHLQPAYEHFPRASQSLSQAEDISKRVLSLPMHPYLTNDQLEYITYWVKNALN
ncbi:MAG: DegT/DnrJ/EryC1/StrS family aminotransferase [Candidatus Berkiellales bacterium]